MKGYLKKSAKFFIAFCVIYIAVIALLYKTGNLGEPKAETLLETLKLQLFGTLKGQRMVGIVVLLALTYPFFGFRKRLIAANFERHATQIENAFATCGFKLVSKQDNEWVFKAQGVWNRLKLLYEDEVVVRSVTDGIEISGNRRAVANVVWRLSGYMANLRE